MKKIITCLLVLLLIVGCSSRKSSGGDSYYAPASDSGVAYEGYDPQHYNLNGSENKKEEMSDEKLVYTGSMTLETRDYEKFSEELNAVINKHQGLIQAMREQTNSYGYGRSLVLTLRIPAASFNDFINDLRNGSGSIRDVNTYVDNITQSYNSNEIEIEALKTQHTRLLELLSEAKDLSDIIVLEERISNLEMRLTQLETYKNQMDADVAYSTITLMVNEVKAYSETSFWQRLVNAFGGSFNSFLNRCEDFIIDVIYALPVLIMLAVAFFIFRKPVTGGIRKLVSGVKHISKPEKKDNTEDK